MQYLVSLIARNYLRNVVPDPAVLKVHPRFMYGLEPARFQDGYLALLRLIRTLYADIADKPSDFGMKLIEDSGENPSTEYSASHASMLRVPHLLLALGVSGTLRDDLTLTIAGADFIAAAKSLSITAAPSLLMKLADYGLLVSGFNRAVKPDDSLVVEYPDERALVASLHAMSEAQAELFDGDLRKPKDTFYIMNPALIENQKVKKPKPGVEMLLRALDPDKRALAERLHGFAAAKANPAVKTHGFMRNHWSCVYTGNTSKRVLMTLKSEQDSFTAKLNLANIGQYTDILDEYPDHLREALKNAWGCGRCNPGCAGGFKFELDGKQYDVCRGGAFHFGNVTKDDLPYYIKLLEYELTFN